ncbi:MAG: hypothetical protein GXY83_37340 [Rhodopirellula sp.]|nr:hypothetical protein [Rhodopirellula sp.]
MDSVLGFALLLIGQASGAVPSTISPLTQPAQPAAEEAARPAALPPMSATSAIPSNSPAELGVAGRRALPPEMIGEALTLPSGGAISGRRVTLLEVLAGAIQQPRQADIAHAYWQLAVAVAEYHYAYDESAAVAQFQARPEDAAMLETAKSSAAAALDAAEVDVIEAQSALAEAAMLPVNTAFPLPADPPHVGPYRTQFDELFAMRPAPARARLIDRTLPVRRRGIDARAGAVHAAGDALEALVDAYRQGQVGFTAVLAGMGQLGRQRRALIAAVADYNHDIADYALSVVPPGTSPTTLVGMLIRPSDDSRQPAGNHSAGPLPAGVESSEVRPAMHLAPVDGAAVSPRKRPGQPTLAPPRESVMPAEESTPLTASSDSALAAESSAAAASGVDVPQEKSPPSAGNPEAGTAPSADRPSTPDAQPSDGLERPLTPLSALPPAGRQTAMRPPTGAAAAEPTAALYPALSEMTPPVRCKQLAEALHWVDDTPNDAVEPIALIDFLKAVPSNRREALVGVYWRARQRVAEGKVHGQTAAFYEELEPLVLDRRQEPGGAAAMLQVRAGKLAAQSRRLEAEAELLAAEFRLREAAGRPLDGVGMLPMTPPHAGPYLLKLDSQPPSVVQTRLMQRLAVTVPTLGKSLQQRAAAVVYADSARAGAVAGYRSGHGKLDDCLISITQQTDQTLAFLETLTAYNESIAQYALAVLPRDTPAEVVAKTLVVVE